MGHTRRALAVAVVTAGFTLGAPALALAESGFATSESYAGPDGASITYVQSVVDDQGNVSYEHVTLHAGPDGAGQERTRSSAG
ncbi:hypothetical protein [Nocardiopsis kunsanensis]|uniref:Uncharacterized protein n=1 Tax=Nocardiopsis kunsanensis TaxID=141693 RepID=A0A918X7T9_9ACTN|nr:hypothetical protein [Nocardiopsis kunsanensis]GHD17363.1 hypothetical protein GCM10007147_06430 [Nocardiopsis kunsanensis]